MKQSMRPFIGLAVISAFALTLTACGGGTPTTPGSAEPTSASLVMSIWGSDNDTKSYQQRADAFTATHPGITVTVTNIPTANYLQQVNTMISGGSAPDIILVDGSSGPSLASRGALVDMTPLISAANLDPTSVVDAGRLTGYQLNGEQFALPDRGGNIVFYYNKTMFDAAGLTYPTNGWTWDDMVNAAKALTITSGGQTTQWGVAVDDWPNATASVLNSWGCQWFNSDFTAATINSDACITGLTNYGDLSLTLKVSPTLKDYADFGQNVNRDALFAQGQTAMIWAGVWDAGDFAQQGLSFGIVPPPTGVPGQATMQAFGTGIGISSASANQAAAWEVVQYMFSAEGQQPIVDNQEDVPSANALMSAWEASLPTGVTYDEVTAATSSGMVFSSPALPQMNQISQQLQTDLDDYFNGLSSPSTVLNTANDNINQILAAG